MNWVSERSIAMKCRSFHKALPGCLNGLVNFVCTQIMKMKLNQCLIYFLLKRFTHMSKIDKLFNSLSYLIYLEINQSVKNILKEC